MFYGQHTQRSCSISSLGVAVSPAEIMTPDLLHSLSRIFLWQQIPYVFVLVTGRGMTQDVKYARLILRQPLSYHGMEARDFKCPDMQNISHKIIVCANLIVLVDRSSK